MIAMKFTNGRDIGSPSFCTLLCHSWRPVARRKLVVVGGPSDRTVIACAALKIYLLENCYVSNYRWSPSPVRGQFRTLGRSGGVVAMSSRTPADGKFKTSRVAVVVVFTAGILVTGAKRYRWPVLR